MTSPDPDKQNDSSSGRLFWLLVLLFMLWLVVVLASYYVVQNAYLGPVYDALAGGIRWLRPVFSGSSLLRSALDLLAAVWILFAALGVGRWLLARLKLPRLTVLEELLFGQATGLGALALLVLFLGLAGLLQRPALIGLAILLTLVTARSNWDFLRGLTLPRPGLSVALLLLATAGLALSLALLPPTSWDGLFYHLTGPQWHLEQGAIRPGPDVPHLNFPALMEMNFLLAMAIRGATAAVPLHLAFGLLLTGLVYALAREVLAVKNGWLAVLFLLSIPMIFSLAGWAYSDLSLAFFQVGALYSLLRWRGQKRAGERGSSGAQEQVAGEAGWRARLQGEGWLILGGILCGLAMGVKYTSFVAPLTLLALLLWWQRRALAGVLWPAAVLLGVAALVASPWYVKNLAFTGNPVYPFVFGGRDWDSFRAAAYAESSTGIGYDPETCQSGATVHLVGQHAQGCQLSPAVLARRLLTLPYDLTLGIRDASRDGDTGPLLLLFLPLLVGYALFRPGRHRGTGGPPEAYFALLFFALAQYLFWTAGVIVSASLWQSRLLLPALAALCPAVAWLLEDLARFDRPKFSLQRQLFLVIGLVLLIGLAIRLATWLPQQPWAYLMGDETAEENLTRRLGWHYLAMESVNALPDEARVAFLWEPRSYYCRRDCRPDSILDEFGHLTYQHGDADSIAAAWQKQGVSHVLLFQAGLDLILAANSAGDEPLPEPVILGDLQRDHLELVETIGDDIYLLYALRPKAEDF